MVGKTGNHKVIKQFLAYQQSTTAQPLQMAQFEIKLAKHIPADTIIFYETLTLTPAVTRYLPPAKPGKYFVIRGGSLGIGFPGAMGVKLLHPKITVIDYWQMAAASTPSFRKIVLACNYHHNIKI